MTSKYEEIEYDYDLVFDEDEVGSFGWGWYYGLTTDYTSPADILIRGLKEDGDEPLKTKTLAKEVVKRWNAYNSLRDLKASVDVEELREALITMEWLINTPQPQYSMGSEPHKDIYKSYKAAQKLLEFLGGAE